MHLGDYIILTQMQNFTSFILPILESVHVSLDHSLSMAHGGFIWVLCHAEI